MTASTVPLDSDATAELRRVLLETKAHCESSDETGYSHLTTGEVVHQLTTAIACLDERRRPDFDTLNILFAPTCSLQDIAIDNGWGEEFLALAKDYDVASQETNWRTSRG